MSANDTSANGQPPLLKRPTNEHIPLEDNGGKRPNSDVIEEKPLEENFPEGGLRAWLTVSGAYVVVVWTIDTL
jgi:hypothetical protein